MEVRKVVVDRLGNGKRLRRDGKGKRKRRERFGEKRGKRG